MKKIIYKKTNLDNLINVSKIVSLHYCEFDKDYKFKGEILNFWGFVYVDKGEAIITNEDKKTLLKQGRIFFYEPNKFHNIESNGTSTCTVFIIFFSCNSKAMELFKEKTLILPKHLRNLIAKIIDVSFKTFKLPLVDPNVVQLEFLDNPLLGGPQLIKIYLEELLIQLIQHDSAAKRSSQFLIEKRVNNDVVSKILKVLHENLYGNINIEEVCEKMNRSKAYLNKIFKDKTGYSIMKYYTLIKVNEAKKLIKEEHYNFTQISDLLCFNNPYYFSHTFKKVTGMSPREYSNTIFSFKNFT